MKGLVKAARVNQITLLFFFFSELHLATTWPNLTEGIVVDNDVYSWVKFPPNTHTVLLQNWHFFAPWMMKIEQRCNRFFIALSNSWICMMHENNSSWCQCQIHVSSPRKEPVTHNNFSQLRRRGCVCVWGGKRAPPYKRPSQKLIHAALFYTF